MNPARLVGAGGLLIVGSLPAIACGDADQPARSVPASTPAADAYGSIAEAAAVGIDPEIQQRYGAAVDALGLRITRAARYEKLGGQEPTPGGTHLAIYVEPVGDVTDADYVRRIQPLADTFLPEVFDEVPELETVDVCQEPPPAVDRATAPKPYTQLLASRAQAAQSTGRRPRCSNS